MLGPTGWGRGELVSCPQCWGASGVGPGAVDHPLFPHGSLEVLVLQLSLPEPGIGRIIIIIITTRIMHRQQDCSLSCPFVPPG